MLLSTAYFPPIAWFQYAFANKEFTLETWEHYNKQTYRNRCKILTATGVKDLVIPIQHKADKQIITDVFSDGSIAWKRQHWQTLQAAYGKAPYFLYYRDAIEPFFTGSNEEPLFDFNHKLIQCICQLLKMDLHVNLSTEFITTSASDKRNYFHAKGNPVASELLGEVEYLQVFAERQPFVANLSILDLLFNLGPDAREKILPL